MRERIVILPLGSHRFAVFIDHGGQTSYHRLVLDGEFLSEAGLAAAAEETVAFETVSYLLEASPEGTLPELLLLATSHDADPKLLPELQARLAATAQ